MAVVNIAITIPDAHITRVQVAFRAMQADDTLTNAQIIELIRQRTMRDIREITLDHERRTAAAAVTTT